MHVFVVSTYPEPEQFSLCLHNVFLCRQRLCLVPYPSGLLNGLWPLHFQRNTL